MLKVLFRVHLLEYPLCAAKRINGLRKKNERQVHLIFFEEREKILSVKIGVHGGRYNCIVHGSS
jgi:hypothetical protein